MDISMMLLLCVAVILTVKGSANSLYIPDISNSSLTNMITVPAKLREPKTLDDSEKIDKIDVIENIQQVVKEFQSENSNFNINDEIINPQPMNDNESSNLNLGKSSSQHDELSFGHSIFKINLKPEDNQYQIPVEASPFLPLAPPVRARSVDSVPIQVNVSNEITNKTNLESKSLEIEGNGNPVEISMSDLEDHIRNEVHEEIQKEKSFESTIIDVLGDIPEPEVRETLKQDLLDSNYSEKQKEVIENSSAIGEGIDFVAQDDKNESEAKEQTKRLENLDENSDKNVAENTPTNLDQKDLKIESRIEGLNDNIPKNEDENRLEIVPEEKTDLSREEKSLTGMDSNQDDESIHKSLLKVETNLDTSHLTDLLQTIASEVTEIAQIQLENELHKTSTKILDDTEKLTSVDSTTNQNLNLNEEFKAREKITEKDVNEMKTQEQLYNDSIMKIIPEKTDNFTPEITENLISVEEKKIKATERENYDETLLKSVESVKMKNDKVELADMNIDQKVSDAEHTGLESYNSTSHIKTVVDEDIIISHVEQESSEAGHSDVNQNEKSLQNKLRLTDDSSNSEIESGRAEDRNNFTVVTETQFSTRKTLVEDEIENEDHKILHLPNTNDNEFHQVIPITSTENLSAPLVLPESGPQIKELLRSLHSKTKEDVNLSKIPLQFPDSSSEEVPVLSAFSISTFEPEIFPSSEQITLISKNDEISISNEKSSKSFQEETTSILPNLTDNMIDYETSSTETVKEVNEDSNSQILPKKFVLNEGKGNEEHQISEILNLDSVAHLPEKFNEELIKEDDKVLNNVEISETNKEPAQENSFEQAKSLTVETETNQQKFEYRVEDTTSSTTNYDKVEYETTVHEQFITSTDFLQEKENYELANPLLKAVPGEQDESSTVLNEVNKKRLEDIPMIIEYHNVEIPDATTDVINPQSQAKYSEKTADKEDLKAVSEEFGENLDTSTELVVSADNEENAIENEGDTSTHSNRSEQTLSENETRNMPNDVPKESSSQTDFIADTKVEHNNLNSAEEIMNSLYEETTTSKKYEVTNIKDHSESSSEESSDSSEEKDSVRGSEDENSSMDSVESSSEPLKFILYDLLSKPVENSEEVDQIDSKIASAHKEIPRVSSRFNQGRSLSFDDVDSDHILRNNLHKPLTEVVLSDEIELPLNYDHTVIKRPGVDRESKDNSREISDSNSGYPDADDKSTTNSQSNTPVEERSFNNDDNPELQTAFTEILIEAAELTTDINRQILSFRSSSETYTDIPNETTDTLEIENNHSMDSNDMEQIQRAKIVDKLIENDKSNMRIMIMVLISFVGLITVIAISIAVFYKLRNQTVTLDIQMEEQQLQRLQQEEQQQNKHCAEHEDEQQQLQAKDMDIETEQTLINDLEKQR